MEAYQGYFENGRFVPEDNISIPGRRRVIMTVLDEPTPKDTLGKQHRAVSRFIKEMKTCEESLGAEFDAVVSKRMNLTRENTL
jgi:hypothetical protein